MLVPEEVIRADALATMRGGRVWLVTTSGGWGSDMTVLVPSWWVKESEEKRFPDLFGTPRDYVVQAYTVPN